MARNSVRALVGELPTSLSWLFGALVFGAFLTQSRFVPGIKYNVGIFEVLGLVFLLSFALRAGLRHEWRLHEVHFTLLALLLLAVVSQINTPANRRLVAMAHIAVLAYLFCFEALFYNLMQRYKVSTAYLLRVVVLTILVIGPWILIQTSQSSDINLAGPFRNRAHMGSYMLTAFWISLIYTQWPRLPRREQLFGYLAVAMTLYAVAISGRRSVYLSLMVGLLLLALGPLAAARGRRRGVVLGMVFTLLVGAGLYFVGSGEVDRLSFFRNRVALVDDRILAAVGAEAEGPQDTFFDLQKRGVRLAVETHPVLGVGWGGFPKSRYSLTGHEVHSTPLRFLAEMGLVGIALYTVLMVQLVVAATRTFQRLRRTAFAGTAFTSLVGLLSLSVSYLYNRHVTERTFWLLVVVIIGLDVLSKATERQLSAWRQSAEQLPSGSS